MEQFRRWFSVFPRERFFVESLEAFRRDPVAVYTEVCTFLGVDAVGSASFPTAAALKAQLARRYNEGLNQVRLRSPAPTRGPFDPSPLRTAGHGTNP